MNPPDPTDPIDGAEPGAADEVVVLTSGGAREQRKPEEIRKHDFRQSGFLAPSELRSIRLRHEQFVRALAARLAIFLRLEFSIQLTKIQIDAYQKFIDSLPSPTHITLFKIDPLKGMGLLVIPPRLGLSMVDRLLGGAGAMTEANRDLSEIEMALVDQISTLLLTEWCNQWPEMRELHSVLLGHENNSRFLQTSAPDAAMLVVTLQAGVGDQIEPMQLALPYSTIEPLVRLLCPGGMSEGEAAASRSSRPKWNDEFNEVPVPVSAEWQGLKLSAGEVARLKAGDVLLLDARSASQVHLRLNEVSKFLGRPGTRAGKWAVELSSPITT